jgi:CRP-like cAMP-binding protein
MFAPLSIVIKERLAQSLSPVSIRAGETLIHSGDAGDRLYLVRNGRLAIVRAGLQVATLSDGDCVGEIALLHRVPRTASVRAEVDTALYSLGREAFLHSITGTPAALTEAHRVASERLAEHDDLRPPPTDERS